MTEHDPDRVSAKCVAVSAPESGHRPRALRCPLRAKLRHGLIRISNEKADKKAMMQWLRR
jgi:hypothetical protein